LIAGSTMAHANDNDAPYHHGFAVELAGGLAMMGGHPYSDTEIPVIKQGDQVLNDLKFSRYTGTTDDAEFNVGSDIPVGYRAQWNTMTGSANNNRVDFAGQLNLHYMMKKGSIGAGVYAGVGYNGARDSSTYTDTFDNTVYKNEWAEKVAANSSFSIPNGTTLGNHPTVTFINARQGTSTDDQIAMNADMPTCKATISSGLTLQAGARIGPMLGRVFPHFRVGWTAYQMKAHMTNQMASYSKESIMNVDSYHANAAITKDQGFIVGDHIPDPTTGANNIGAGQGISSMEPLYETGNRIKVDSQGSKWSNAVTLGAGVDWYFKKMTLGVYYQAAICQQVTFNKWNQDITGGMTSSEANFPTQPQTGIGIDQVPTSGRVITTYGSTPPTVSIKPLIQTVMFSAKYIINKS